MYTVFSEDRLRRLIFGVAVKVRDRGGRSVKGD